MDIEVVVKKASMEFYQGTLNGREAVLVRSGIGKVNAGLCAQILVDVFNVGYLINTGIAGSLKPEINIGDIVVSSDALQHDMDARAFGYARGEIPRMDTVSFPAIRSWWLWQRLPARKQTLRCRYLWEELLREISL